VVVAGFGGVASGWLLDKSRRKDDRKIREAAAREATEALRSQLYSDVLDAAGRLTFAQQVVEPNGRGHLQTALMHVMLKGESAPAKCATEWSRAITADGPWKELEPWSVKFLDACRGGSLRLIVLITMSA